VSSRAKAAIAAIERAYATIGFYKRMGAKLADREAVERAAPMLGRATVRGTLPKQWVADGVDSKTLLSSGDLELLETGATAEERMRVVAPRGGVVAERRAALGERGKIATLIAPGHGRGACHVGESEMNDRVLRDTLTLVQHPDASAWQASVAKQILDEIAAYAPALLDGDAPYVAAVAAEAERSSRTIDVARIALGGSFATAASMRAIARAAPKATLQRSVGGPETGPILIDRDGQLTSSDALYVEARATKLEGISSLIVTHLAREVMPLVRYVTIELVSEGAFEDGRAIGVRYEGRADEAVVQPGGAIATLGAIDRALAGVAELDGYQLSVRADAVRLDVVAASSAVEVARDALAAVLPKMSVTARAITALSAEPNGQYRVVRREPGAPDAAAALGLS
jgi:hypothetical protein